MLLLHTMTATKIAVIGAGSAVFAAEFIHSICLTPGLSGSKISLMDVNVEGLNTVYNLGKRFAAESKADIGFEKTTDREEALKDAGFVINTALVGGHEQQETVREIGENHGYYRGIDSQEFNMVSDYYTISNYNQLKFFLDVARDIERICPDAWLIQCANPVFEGTTLLTRHSKIKVVGLCHDHLLYQNIAEILGIDPKEVTCRAVGFNHWIWMTDFHYKGEDASHLIDEWIETKAEVYWKSRNLDYWETDMSPAAVDMYKMYGLFPVGDTVRSGSWKYHINLETKKKWYGPTGGWDSEIGFARYLDSLKENTNAVLELSQDPSVSLMGALPRPAERWIVPIVPFIDSVVNDKGNMAQVNVPNKGTIHGIPDDVVVEVPAFVDKRGIRTVHVGKLPRRLMTYVLIPRMLRMEWALEAFLTGDKEILVEILLRDPRTRSEEQARAVLEEILMLPFNEEMRKHYT